MIDMLSRKKNRSVKKALEPYKAEVGPARCPSCGKVAKTFPARNPQGLVCRDCLEPKAWP